ncbi:MAG: diadenylate cyclase CdaA [Clostridiales bacterium]|jgi:diadenylate cyclase|nr:diadenylate cyclase CdaA [Clostridiales bacterium]
MLQRINELFANINIPEFNMPEISFSAVLDILIVAYMVYFVLQWIRQTRAWSLFKGVVFILAIAAAAGLFNLVTVLWILQNAFAMGLILIVVLFQPELRNALEKIGRGRLFSSLVKSGNGDGRISIDTVNEIVKAVKEMSAARTGALIVMEQDVALGDHEQTGISVDALVSSQLLMNIFEKNTPLHDGAVIIRQNRVVAAACILPLTSDEVSHDLGTRHRAAIGITEISDAMVVVVSEETGSISVATVGVIKRKINEYELRDILSSGGDQPERISFNPFKGKKKIS